MQNKFKCFLWLIVGCAIVLLTAQIKIYLAEDNSYCLDVPVIHQKQEVFANVVIETKEQLSLPQAKVLVNNSEVADFRCGKVVVRVYDNDTLTLDVDAYSQAQTFLITDYSANIQEECLPSLVQIIQGQKRLSFIKLK